MFFLGFRGAGEERDCMDADIRGTDDTHPSVDNRPSDDGCLLDTGSEEVAEGFEGHGGSGLSNRAGSGGTGGTSLLSLELREP